MRSFCATVYKPSAILFDVNRAVHRNIISIVRPTSLVGIATDYRLDGPGSNPGGDEIFRPSRPALGLTQAPIKWVPGLSRGLSAAGACC